MGIRLLICGSRKWKARNPIYVVLFGIEEICEYDVTLIHGACPTGADDIASDWGDTHLPPEKHLKFPAHWEHGNACEFECDEVCGKAAGHIRNKKMLDVAKPDLVYAFADDLSVSPGTKGMIELAKKAGVPVIRVGSV